MKKGVINESRIAFASLILFSAIILTISFVLAAHVITTSTGGTSYSVDEDVGFIYNITVNNTDTTETANITQVNITIPNTFTFLADSNGTDAGTHTFTNTSTVLSWDNDGLVMNLTWKYFWFNATASTPGSYNLTISTTNSTGTETTNISVTINDTTDPSTIEFVSPTESDNSNLSQSNIAINVTAEDNGVIDTIIARLFNSTSDQINSSTSSTSPLFINFTGLSDGVYYFNATVNDTYGNSNSTSTRTLTLDTTYPLIDYGTGTESDNSNLSQSNVYVNVSVTETNEKNITFLLYNSTGQVNSTTYTDGTRTINWTSLPDGAYTYNVTVIDIAENSNTTSTRTLTLDITNPTASPSCIPSSVYVNDVVTCTCGGSDGGGSGINSALTTAPSTPSTSSSGTFTYSCSVTDYAGNTASFSAKYVVNAVSSGGGSSTTSFWKSTHAISDEEFQNSYTKQLSKTERIRVSVNNEYHYVGVRELTETSATIEITSEPVQVKLEIGQDAKFDVTDDGYYDIYVLLNSITGGKAEITIKEINEEIPEGESVVSTTGEEVTPKEGGNVEAKSYNWIYWIVGIIIVLIVVWFVISKKRKNKEYFNKPQEYIST